MHTASDIRGVNPQDLDCINLWPKGSKGYQETQEALAMLVELCNRHGYGGLPQMAQWLEDIWRNPERIEEYKKRKREHFERCGWDLSKL